MPKINYRKKGKFITLLSNGDNLDSNRSSYILKHNTSTSYINKPTPQSQQQADTHKPPTITTGIASRPFG